MAPLKLRQSSSSTSTTTTSSSTAKTLTTSSSSSSQDARILVRETIRISANLASAPSSSPQIPPTTPASFPGSKNLRLGLVEDDYIDSNLRLICCEEIDGRRWKYVAENDSFGKFKKGSVRSVSLQTPQAPIDELTSFIRSYVVPEGFPDSVSPSYVPYMTWRALKHFFGGAMGVFTTQTLLTSVGVSRNRATPGAVAINWILKDGAGRVGKMLFARQGKKFDYDLKQLRFAGDLLMELGAGVELATAAMPNLFLPLACAANVAKNVAAVTSTSTRTPIYKAFAKGENIGDVTAKGECVGNVADLLGTGLSIMLSKRNPSLFTTFGFLSCGYILSSYQEVKSVVLSTLNRARFTVAVDSFLKTGSVPSLKEGNLKESVFAFPWVQDISVQLGCRFKDAFQDPGVYIALEPLFEREKYIVTYNPMKNRVCALLKDHAKSEDILKAAFHGHVLNHFIRSLVKKQTGMYYEHDNIDSIAMPPNIESLVAESCKLVSTTYSLFKYKAAEQGWVMSESLLNPGRARLCQD
ncbi:Protein root UVB sensitive 6 [Bienertia sinuspersici]